MTPKEELELLMLMSEETGGEEDAGGIFRRIMMGLGDVVYGGGQFLENATEAIAPGAAETVQGWDESLYRNTGGLFGSPEGVTMDDKVAARERIYQQETGIQPGEFDGARLGGQVLSGLAAPLARGLPALIAEGALFNSAMPTVPEQGETYWDEKTGDAMVGAIGGVAAKGIQDVGGHVVDQYARPALQRMREAGVEPTIGQSIGGGANTLEEAAGSIPFVGPLFSAPRGRAQDEWQLSVLNRVVGPIGGRVDSIGSAGVAQASRQINEAYDAAFEAMPAMAITPDVGKAISTAVGDAVDLGMNEGAEKQFRTILDRVVYSRMPKDVPDRVGPSQARDIDEVTSQNLKKIDSELTAKIGAKGADPQLKAALTKVREAIRSEAAAQSGEYGRLIQGADYSYAMFKRVTKAQNMDSTQDAFKPSQMVNATKRGVSENTAARGEGLMQGDAMAAQQVLGDKLNNSGTAERLAAMALGTGAGLSISPTAALAAPLLGLGGTMSGQRFGNQMIKSLLAPGMQKWTPGSAYGLLTNEVLD